MIDTTLWSEKFLHFRENLIERIQKLIMTIDDKITDEKLKLISVYINEINTETAKISPFSSDEIDKYKYLTGV